MISVIIPVLNESATIQSVICHAVQATGVTEVIVVDDGSIDGTPDLAKEAGASVVTSTLLGKGASMEDGVRAATNEVLVFLDGDLSGLHRDLLTRLTEPILQGSADFVKARFTRNAGRVTVLTARPLLKTFFPELNHLEQPLGGIIAARRSVLQKLRFETDYGVDVGLLLDVAMSGAVIEQVDIGRIEHDSQTLDVLGDMARQVVRVILDRAGKYGRLNLQQVQEVEEVERRSQAELDRMLLIRDRPAKLALFDMDGTLLNGRFAVSLAARTGSTAELEQLLDHDEIAPDQRTRRIAAVFAGVRRNVFEEVARSIPLTQGAVEVVVGLRKSGYRVGVLSDSFTVATEVVRRRVFADFSAAHLMKFRNDVASGDVRLCPAMTHVNGCRWHPQCKRNVMLHVCEQLGLGPDQVLAVGDGVTDACLLSSARISVAFEPKSDLVRSAAQHVIEGNLLTILDLVDQ